MQMIIEVVRVLKVRLDSTEALECVGAEMCDLLDEELDRILTRARSPRRYSPSFLRGAVNGVAEEMRRGGMLDVPSVPDPLALRLEDLTPMIRSSVYTPNEIRLWKGLPQLSLWRWTGKGHEPPCRRAWVEWIREKIFRLPPRWCFLIDHSSALAELHAALKTGAKVVGGFDPNSATLTRG